MKFFLVIFYLLSFRAHKCTWTQIAIIKILIFTIQMHLCVQWCDEYSIIITLLMPTSGHLLSKPQDFLLNN